jgi:GT2 family glycosyltransferase
MKEIAVLIVTYNGKKWIQKSINSIINSNTKAEIFIVDNNSNDGTLQILEKTKEINLIKLNKNLGFGAANNIGISKICSLGYKYTFLINQDVYLFPESISTLYECLKDHKNYSIISPIHLDSTQKKLDPGFEQYVKSSNLLSQLILDRNTKAPCQIDFVNAAAWFCNNDIFYSVGGFNPTFFHYGEDFNYCQRLKFLNYKIGICQNSKIIHDREKRKTEYLNSFNKVKSNELTLVFSAPSFQNSKVEWFFIELKKLLISWVILIRTIPILISINHKVKRNKEQTKIIGANFLEFNKD